MDIIDKLLETPCYIMDFLPKQVPINCGGQFFEVETYLLNHYHCCGLRDRFVGVILKAMIVLQFRWYICTVVIIYQVPSGQTLEISNCFRSRQLSSCRSAAGRGRGAFDRPISVSEVCTGKLWGRCLYCCEQYPAGYTKSAQTVKAVRALFCISSTPRREPAFFQAPRAAYGFRPAGRRACR